MGSSSSCLGERKLRDLANGQLVGPEAQAAREHLGSCPGCRRELAELERGRGVDPGETRDAVKTVAYGTTVTDPHEPGDDPGDDQEITADLGFLDPPTQPDMLGRIGDYRVLDVLGVGGMGLVYKAFDEVLHRVVAIKVMAPKLATSRRARTRFIREARAAAAINHPNVVTIHAVSTHKDMPYLVMEYIAGVSLRQRLKKGPPLEPVEVLRIGLQIASGLNAAHDHGVIHRDIKPANIMLEDGVERVKIMDFGLALAAVDNSELTSLNQTLGTPAYMSPEQVTSSRQVDCRSDLFGLGCVMYAMLAGHSPFRGAHTLEVIRNVCDLHPRPVHEVNPKVPREHSDVVHRLLAKDPDDRFQSASELADVLKRQVAAANAADSQGGLPRGQARSRRPSISRRGAWLTIASFAAAAIGLIAWRSGPFGRPHSDPVVGGPPPVEARAGLITVAGSLAADARTIAEALGRARPGTTVRILDDGAYDGPVAIGDRDRLRDLTIESPRRATIAAPPGSSAVLTIDGTPGVTIRGVTLRATESQHGLIVGGDVAGLRIEDVRLQQPGTSMKAAVYLRPGVQGTSEHPVVIDRLDLDCGTLGVAIMGDRGRPASWVRLENSKVIGTGVLLLLDGALAHVVVARNVFSGGHNGMNLNLHVPGGSEEIVVCQNTFYSIKHWMGLSESDLGQGRIEICRNLILDSTGVEVYHGQDLGQVAGSWFRENVWVPSRGAHEDQARLLATVRDRVPVLSTDRTSPDFLVPTPDAALGEGPSSVGARPPAAANSHVRDHQ